MKVLELFSGTASFSKAARARGHEAFTVDLDPAMKPDLVKSVLLLTPEDVPFRPDVIWASPPCQCFSVATLSRNWRIIGGIHHPISPGAVLAVKMVEETLDIIEAMDPVCWFIENPRDKLRSLDLMKPYRRKTVTYCQYGDFRMKPTDIWTNCMDWHPKPPCKNGDRCHESAPRGTKRGTQRLDGAKARGEIPQPLMEEIVIACENAVMRKVVESED